jgi:hypothetical protein
MRTLSPLLGLCLLAGASCSTLHRFHESSPGLHDGSWRVGGFLGGLGDSSEINGVDDDAASMGFDVGKVIGDSGEFGVRIAATDFDDADADVMSAGPYLRWYFPGAYGLRPLLDFSGALAGIDFGPGDDSGWSLSAGIGMIYVLHERFGIELVLRQTYGDFETGDDTSIAEATVGVSMFF